MTKLGPLPKNWKIKKIKDVAEIKSGGNAPQGTKYFENGKFPFIRVKHFDGKRDYVSEWDLINELAIKDYNLKVFPKDSIIFPKSGASIKLEKRAMLPKDSYVVNHLCVINAKRNINNKFLFYYLKTVAFSKDSAGTSLPYLTLSRISEQKVIYPPISEQEMIVKILSTVQEAIERTEAVIRAARELKRSMIKYLFTYGFIPLGESANVPLKETEIGLIPEEWKLIEFGDIIETKYGYTASANEKKVGPKFLRITDINDEGGINWSTVPYCQISSNDYEKFGLIEDDILIARIGATTGKSCIIKDPPKSVFASYLIRVQVTNKKTLSPDFVYYFTKSPHYWIQINSSKGGKLKKGISATSLKKIKIGVGDIDSQKRIVEILSKIDEKIESEENKKKALEELFKTLLNDLMTAKLRVSDLNLGFCDENE